MDELFFSNLASRLHYTSINTNWIADWLDDLLFSLEDRFIDGWNWKMKEPIALNHMIWLRILRGLYLDWAKVLRMPKGPGLLDYSDYSRLHAKTVTFKCCSELSSSAKIDVGEVAKITQCHFSRKKNTRIPPNFLQNNLISLPSCSGSKIHEPLA